MNENEMKMIEEMATHMVDFPIYAGCRIVGEDEIVIKKSEYEALKKAKNIIQLDISEELLKEYEYEMQELRQKERKETAREILQELTAKGTIHAEYDWNEYFEIDVDELKKLAKSRGIEFGG